MLEPLLCRHPYWGRLRDILENGSSWPLTTTMDEEKRKKRNLELVNRGYHASTRVYAKELQDILQIERF